MAGHEVAAIGRAETMGGEEMTEDDTDIDYGWIVGDDPRFQTPDFVAFDNTELVDLILSGEIEP